MIVDEKLIEADERLIEAVEELAFGVVGLTSRALAETGQENELTLAQWRVLVILGQGPMRVGAIAERIGSSLASASRLVARMEARGFVGTARDDSDRRATLVSLAPPGVEVRARTIEIRRRLIRDLIAREPVPNGASLEQGLGVLAARFSRYG
jgi:DNA-binding MarR family transcriptional regulator